MNKPTDARKARLWKVCEDFIKAQRIGSAETIYQSDRVIENAYEFIDNVCGVVGFEREEDDEDA